jgi:hypothetical protein
VDSMYQADIQPPTLIPKNPVLEPTQDMNPDPDFYGPNEDGPPEPDYVVNVRAGQAAPDAWTVPNPADATFEPEARIEHSHQSGVREDNRDEYDDGVSLRGPLVPGVPVLMDILVNTNGFAAGRYDAYEAGHRLYLNGWEDWDGNGQFNWAPWPANWIVDVDLEGPPAIPPTPSDEYILHWEGSPAMDKFASANFCGGVAVGPNARVLTFWITPPAWWYKDTLWERFRLDYGEDVGMNLCDYSDPSLIHPIGTALDPYDPTHIGLAHGFDKGEAQFGEVEDYRYVKPSCCNHDNIRGDVNYDLQGPNIVDLTYLVAYLFGGGAEPPCTEEGDANADEAVNIVDLTYLVAYLFSSGPPPEPCS